MGYIGRSGRFIWRDDKRRFDDLGDFHDGYAKALAGDKWGYIDKTGRWRIEPRFDDARDFHRGFAAVLVGDRWGYVDKTGRVAIAPRFDTADDFDDILAMVTLNDRFGFVNKTGALTIPPRFIYAEPYFPPLRPYIDRIELPELRVHRYGGERDLGPEKGARRIRGRDFATANPDGDHRVHAQADSGQPRAPASTVASADPAAVSAGLPVRRGAAATTVGRRPIIDVRAGEPLQFG